GRPPPVRRWPDRGSVGLVRYSSSCVQDPGTGPGSTDPGITEILSETHGPSTDKCHATTSLSSTGCPPLRTDESSVFSTRVVPVARWGPEVDDTGAELSKFCFVPGTW